jgi:flavoprotein
VRVQRERESRVQSPESRDSESGSDLCAYNVIWNTPATASAIADIAADIAETVGADSVERALHFSNTPGAAGTVVH